MVNNKITHQLHVRVGDIFTDFEARKKAKFELYLDSACDKHNKHPNIPFFIGNELTNETEITNVDILLLQNGKVRAICEIEESNVKPNNILGKLTSVAIADRARVILNGKTDEIEVGNNVVFIHILSTKKIDDDKSRKPGQWKNIEAKVKSKCPFFNISEYHLIYGDITNFYKGNNGEKELLKILRKL